MAELEGEASSEVSTCLVPCTLWQTTASQLPQMFHGPKKIVYGRRIEQAPKTRIMNTYARQGGTSFTTRSPLIEGGRAAIRPRSRCFLRFRGSLSSLSPFILVSLAFFFPTSSLPRRSSLFGIPILDTGRIPEKMESSGIVELL